MKIESIIRRAKGTRVTLDETTYHFKPTADDPKGPHVAEVADEDHAERLLNIAEGFRKAGKTAAKEPEKPDASAGSQVLQGADGAGKAGGNADATPPAQPRATVKKGGAAVPAKDKKAK